MLRKVAVVAVLLGSSTFATAQTGTPEEQAACRPDVAKHCRGIGGDKDVVQRHDPILSVLAPGRGDIPATPNREGRDPRV